MTDPYFKYAIDKVSYNNQLYFTRRQLWYEVNRGLWRKRRTNPLKNALIVGIAALIFIPPPTETKIIGTLICIALAVLVSLIWNYAFKTAPRHQPKISLDHFTHSMLSRWNSIQGKPAKLLTKSDKSIAVDPRGDEADLTDYSFDRLVITENMDTAVMLLANRLHLEKKCAVLCAKDLHSDKANIILKMVEHNPQLKVLVVHDASIEGCGLPARLRQEPWFHEDLVELIDLGLRPNQVRKLRMFTNKMLAAQILAEDAQIEHLSPEETDWLKQGYSAELEALRSRRLLRSISHGFVLAEEADLAKEMEDDDWEFDFGEGVIWIESFG